MERINEGYKIVQAVRIGRTEEVVIGFNPKAVQPYVCWYCLNGGNYFTGHYDYSFKGALKDLAVRIINVYDSLPHDWEEANQ